MSNLLAHGGMFMAGNTLLVFLPFIVAGAGLGFIMRAFTDKVDRRPDDDGPARSRRARHGPPARRWPSSDTALSQGGGERDGWRESCLRPS